MVEAREAPAACRAVKLKDARTVVSSKAVGTANAMSVHHSAATRPGGHNEAAAGQPPPQSFLRPREPGEDGPPRAAEPQRRRLGGQALQVAEHDRLAVASRQPGDFLMQLGPGFGPGPTRPEDEWATARRRSALWIRVEPRRPWPAGRRGGRRRGASRLPSRRCGSSRPCGPGRGRWPGTHPGRRVVAEYVPAGPEHHRAVTVGQGREGGLGGASGPDRTWSPSWPSDSPPIAPTL